MINKKQTTDKTVPNCGKNQHIYILNSKSENIRKFLAVTKYMVKVTRAKM